MTSVVASVVNIDICVQVMAINLSNDNFTRSLHHMTSFAALNMFLLYFENRLAILAFLGTGLTFLFPPHFTSIRVIQNFVTLQAIAHFT